MKKYALKFIYYILASLARKVLAEHKPFVIGITGSVGKSSTKEALYQVLKDRFGNDVRANFGNLNAEIGIPLTILGYTELPPKFLWPCFLVGAYFKTYEKEYPKYLILEMGVEHPGDIKYFGTIVNLDLAVITSTAPVHIANFRNHEHLKEEKISISKILKNDGILFANSDDVDLSKIDQKNVVTVSQGESSKATYKALGVNLTLSGTDYRIETTGQKISIQSKVLGRQFIYANLLAFAVGQWFGIQSLEIKKSLEKLRPIPGRMNLIAGKNGVTIIDDTYNASPASVAAAISILAEIDVQRRKVLILGNMNELGGLEKEAHVQIAKFAKGKCDLALFAGPNAALMAQNFGSGSFAFMNRSELMNKLDDFIIKDDLVLIKASQNNNFFEEVTKRLMKNPVEAKSLLVRQSSFWLRKKNNK
ncbi:MAG: UDP-N-acetylmuramoyl-tripeptide--D-alanyl-D-alanine ligase [Candidatus Berkelbacteria bacterium]|nr:UDP-N-acetylmuramoyl-tripeptide--D-alanyl-D-alanine ligase [Candidatus Berkelbacteria bacterium]